MKNRKFLATLLASSIVATNLYAMPTTLELTGEEIVTEEVHLPTILPELEEGYVEEVHLPTILPELGEEVSIPTNPVSTTGSAITLDERNIVQIKDPVLEQKIREMTGVSIGPLTQTHMQWVTSLSLTVSDGIVESLEGLEYCTNLKFLDINRAGNILDLTPLQNLNLSGLTLEGVKKIENLGALANMSTLESLNLRQSRLTDISALTGLTSLNRIDLTGNHIDFSEPSNKSIYESWQNRGVAITEYQILFVAKEGPIELLRLFENIGHDFPLIGDVVASNGGLDLSTPSLYSLRYFRENTVGELKMEITNPSVLKYNEAFDSFEGVEAGETSIIFTYTENSVEWTASVDVVVTEPFSIKLTMVDMETGEPIEGIMTTEDQVDIYETDENGTMHIWAERYNNPLQSGLEYSLRFNSWNKLYNPNSLWYMFQFQDGTSLIEETLQVERNWFTVWGEVKDDEGNWLNEVKATLFDLKTGNVLQQIDDCTITDSLSGFDFLNLWRGEYLLRLEKEGYTTVEEEFEINQQGVSFKTSNIFTTELSTELVMPLTKEEPPVQPPVTPDIPLVPVEPPVVQPPTTPDIPLVPVEPSIPVQPPIKPEPPTVEPERPSPTRPKPSYIVRPTVEEKEEVVEEKQRIKISFILGHNKWFVNDVEQHEYIMDALPTITNNSFYVPIRYLAYAFGVTPGEVYWMPEDGRQAFVVDKDVEIRTFEDTNLGIAYDTSFETHAPIYMDKADRIMLPVINVLETFTDRDPSVEWHDDIKKVDIWVDYIEK